MFNLTSVEELRRHVGVSASGLRGRDPPPFEDVASLLRADGLDAHDLWNITQHSRKKLINEVRTKP
jgi:hypothetical protein